MAVRLRAVQKRQVNEKTVPAIGLVLISRKPPFAFRLSPFAFRLSPFAFRLSPY
jgi:hypothetical protein